MTKKDKNRERTMKMILWLKRNWITILLFGCFVFMHCYELSEIPRGMCVDEAAAAYDGWCLNHFGTDREYRPYPIYFKNFGGGQSVLYGYILAFLFCFFDMSLLVIRVPVLISNILFAIYGIRIIRQRRFLSKLPEYLFLAGVSFMPVFVVMLRVGLDCHLMVSLSVMFLFYLLKGIETNKLRHYVLAGICGGLVLYSYILSHLIMPLFLLLVAIYLICIRRFRLSRWFVMAIPMGLLAIPLIAFHISNMLELLDPKFGPFTLVRLWCYNERSGEMSLQNFVRMLPIALRDIFVFDEIRFNTVTHFFNLYAPTIVFFTIGFILTIRRSVHNIKEKNFSIATVLLIWWICEFLLGCSTDSLCTYKMNGIFFAVMFIALEGLMWLLEKKNKTVNKVLVVTAAFCCVQATRFTYYYFNAYPAETWPIYLFGGTMDEVVSYLENYEDKEKGDIYFGEMNKPQIYYAVAAHQEPKEFQNIDPDNGNLHFYLPDLEQGCDWNAVYVVQNSEVEYIRMLEQSGYSSVVCGEYKVLSHPWKNYVSVEAEVPYTVDHQELIGDPKSLKFSGWSINAATTRNWDAILIETDSKVYSAKTTRRPDVAEVLRNESFLHSGYEVQIPQDDAQNAVVLFIDNENQICYRTNLIIGE